MNEKIISLQNPKIKNLIHLQKAKNRRSENVIIIEGEREIFLALSAGIVIENLFYCSELAKNEYKILDKVNPDLTVEITKEIFDKISYREHPDGYFVLAKPKYLDLAEIKIKPKPFIIVLESVEKPGNLGAILRTADAAGADAVIVCDPQTDIYNPNVIRASQGTVFTKQVVVCSTAEAIDWLAEKKISSYAATPDTDKLYTDSNFSDSSAIVFGTEDKGLSDEWLDRATEKIKIPMLGTIDSLNVSNSAAIMIYEVVRQRK